MNRSDWEEIDQHCNELFTVCENFSLGTSLDSLCNGFRYLRNACVSGKEHQNYIAKHVCGLTCIAQIIDSMIQLIPNTEERNVCVRLGVQLLGNMTVDNDQTKKIVWEKCCNTFSSTINCGDKKSANYTAMAVYNIFLGNLEEEPWKELDLGFVSGLITSAVNGSEYGLFTVELFLKSQGWLARYYPSLSLEQRFYILDLMSNNVSAINNDDATKESRKFHVSALQFISDEFRSHSDLILDARTFCKPEKGEGREDLPDDIPGVGDPCEVSKWLDVLSSASGNEEYLAALQADEPLLIQAVFLLKSMQLIGKLAEEDGNVQHPFVPIKKLSAAGLIQSECDVELHPVHGFKRNLIRLIGNLAWKNIDVQNKVLELECLPLILDCCNIDERNPFITQWAIMAIHNLCENNHEVQKMIGNLKREGVINSDFLNEMGLSLHDSGNPGGKISIVPLPK